MAKDQPLKIELEENDVIVSLFNTLSKTSKKLLQESYQQEKHRSSYHNRRNQENQELENEMDNWIKGVFHVASGNITVNGEDCTDLIDLDTEPLDLDLENQVKTLEKEVIAMREQMAVERRELPRQIERVLETTLERQMDGEERGIDDEEYTEPETVHLPVIEQETIAEYRRGIKLLQKLERTLPGRASQYEDIERVLGERSS
ncbi:hypothetical protein PHYBLDRAFT_65328 [Phycomyces blakesleeanus NRRL 1555(-)]|uniref:Uncharacterized protein n=2 Tax=Phycomyces blakesleeanus TaxID=4837 RepID=A0A167MFZ8_PHYB8|nr:hypothetical protein PHYBLDRAFT_65328 [Phycomyces blakesleeanus NRRL 1555(-)]OAD72746.1 hypothetical protein PHYBLDRAFT_65328 [Phycomyces blakesleeanus NRRL 1555(-)]|eukprot:XP_018290786.1 hypothetical protein PHYBLDRAFT_65328 [Phycomyces blakesleeanus NRRL 1555(-)]